MDKSEFINGFIRQGSNKEELTNFIRNALLTLYSETPDNIESVKLIEYGDVSKRNSKKSVGLKISKKRIPLSEIMYCIESMNLPDEVKIELPSLTQEEWEAATRIMTLLLISLEREANTIAST